MAAATDDRLELYWLHDTVAIHTGLVPLAVRDQLHPVAVPGQTCDGSDIVRISLFPIDGVTAGCNPHKQIGQRVNVQQINNAIR